MAHGAELDSLLAAEPRAAAMGFAAELRVRGERVQDLPGGREDFERVRAALRLGAQGAPHPAFLWDAGVRAAIGSDENRDNRRNFDNERSDGFDLDRALLRWQPVADAALSAGAMPLPLRTTALLWDEDLRPLGVAWVQRGSWRTYDVWRLAAGGFAVAPLHRHDARVATLQGSWLIREGAPDGGEVTVSWLSCHRLDELRRRGFLRQNTPVPLGREGAGRYRAAFELVDLQLGLRRALGPVEIVLFEDAVVNAGSNTDRFGSRTRVALGGDRGWGRFEVGYVYQRIERDAALAALNSDDWWFHAWTRGHSAFATAEIAERLRLRLSAFRERRDDLDEHTTRVMLDVTAMAGFP